MKKYSKLLRPFANAWGGVTSHKLRSLLTILGIVIGVSAVIALMSIGKGAEADILARIQTLGANLMMITPGSTDGGRRGQRRSRQRRDFDVWKMLRPSQAEDRPGHFSVPDLFQKHAIDRRQPEYECAGHRHNYILHDDIQFEYDQRHLLLRLRLSTGTAVAVLGATVAQTLYGNNDPLGQNLRLGTIIVRVIGVLASKGAVSGSPDNMVFIPLTAMQQAVAQQRTAQRRAGHILHFANGERHKKQRLHRAAAHRSAAHAAPPDRIGG